MEATEAVELEEAEMAAVEKVRAAVMEEEKPEGVTEVRGDVVVSSLLQ